MTRIGMMTLLVITHGAIATMTISLLQVLMEWHFLAQLFVVIIAGGAFGAVLTAGVLNDLQRVETALYRLGQGLRVEPLPTRHREPMRFMMEHVNTLIERERELTTLRLQLSGQIGEAAAQEERSRLARDLHDSIKQQIFSISVSAAAAQARWDVDSTGAQKAMADVRRSAQEAMVEMRAMLQQLAPAPLEKVGLTQALRDQCEALEYRSGAKVTCDIGELPPDERFPPGAQEAIFRVAQEALTNIARHARASQVQLRLEADGGGMTLTILDDGQGFERDSAGKGMGLANMAARAAEIGALLSIESKASAGTSLSMTIPYALPVVPQQDETPPPNEKLVARIVETKLRLQVAAVVLFISLVMVYVFVLALVRGNLDGWVSLVALAFGIGGAVGLFFGGRSLLKGIRGARSVSAEVGVDASQSLLLRYNLWLAGTLLPLFLFIFVPAPLVDSAGTGAAVVFGAVALAGVVGSFARAFRLYHRYILSLPKKDLRAAAHDDFPESAWNRFGWIWSLPMLMNLLYDFPPQFPPLEPGDWMDISLPTTGVLFLTASVVYWRYHSKINGRIDEAGETN